MHRSFDPEIMKKAVEDYPELVSEDYDFAQWLDNHNNVMLVEGDSVGLACYEYPGLYTGHYFFKVGGRKALNLARQMMNWMIENEGAVAFTGTTPVGNKAARWFNRHLGFISQGIVERVNGPYELFTITAKELLNGRSIQGA
jgi:hypothetical protein